MITLPGRNSWQTGVLHHDVTRDSAATGLSNDDPDVVKSRAGTPYAVRDYYSADPHQAACHTTGNLPV